ncbi:MAG TPA: PIN domain-containing protein [Thermomicrobiales bacterium]|jgi:predicted nucleic acid-binding protein
MSAPSAPPSAVLDTSVLYPAWSRVLLLRLARRQPAGFRGIWSRDIARELWRTFEVRAGRRGIAPEQIRHEAAAALYPLRQAFAIVTAESRPPGTPASPLPDPDDAHLWNAALNAGAAYIVSNNTRHFPPPIPQMADGERVLRHHVHGIEFVTAIEFIEDILGLDAAALYGASIPCGGIVRSARSGH